VRGTKTADSHREVPLTGRALAALDRLPAQLATLLFLAPDGGPLNLNILPPPLLARPAVEASGVKTPARIYDLRSTFASNALAAGITVFELAKEALSRTAEINVAYEVLGDPEQSAVPASSGGVGSGLL
jgi:integrase